MSKRRPDKMIEEIYDACASANECTGLFQRLHIDPQEVETFHKMYNEIDGADSTER